MIVSSFRAVPYGQMYYRELEKCKVQSLARSGGNFDRKAYISEETKNELRWLIRNIFDAFAPIKLQSFNLTIFSDASLTKKFSQKNKPCLNQLKPGFCNF